jgi:hypothetical protein
MRKYEKFADEYNMTAEISAKTERSEKESTSPEA